MEQDHIPGWNEAVENPKEGEDEHITEDLTQQAGMVDPETPANEDTDDEPTRIRQAGESKVQDASERPPGGHLPQPGRRRRGMTFTLVPR